MIRLGLGWQQLEVVANWSRGRRRMKSGLIVVLQSK